MKKILFNIVLLLLWVNMAVAANDWVQRTLQTTPSERRFPVMAYIGEGKVLLFGGYTTGTNNETWLYDRNKNQWNQQNPCTIPPQKQYQAQGNKWIPIECVEYIKPSARLNPAMAYIGDDRVLLFGGFDSTYNTETWTYDLSENSWVKKQPKITPSGRLKPAMAYIGDDRVLLFGGSAERQNNETWLYDFSDNKWTLLTPVDGIQPSPRHYHSMTYIGDDQVFLFGGQDEQFNHNNETWIYDLSENKWTLKETDTKPSPRYAHAIAYIGEQRILLFGGWDDRGCDNETWIYDLNKNTWIKDQNSIHPSARFGHQLTETCLNGSCPPILFGGKDENNNAETWVFGGGDYTFSVLNSD